jgi:D-arginine dehydrogenase
MGGAMSKPPIVVIGAGLAGAGTAWHLRRLGAAPIVVIEREALPGTHSSGRNAAILREGMDDPRLAPLAREGASALRTQGLCAFRATGGLLVGRGEDEVSARVPCATGRGRFSPRDGVVDVAGLLAAYLRGQDVRVETEVRGIEGDGRGLVVRTSRGEIRARSVVNAAGPWAGEVGGLALTPTNRHVFVSAEDPTIDRAWPFVWDPGAGYYFRPESGGWLLSPCDEDPAAPGDYRERSEAWEDLATKVARHQPGLGDLHVVRRWVGQRTFAADRLPVIGPDPRTPGLFHVAGLGGHGVTWAHAVGRLAAECVNLGTPPPEDFDPARLLPHRRPAARSAGFDPPVRTREAKG